MRLRRFTALVLTGTLAGTLCTWTGSPAGAGALNQIPVTTTADVTSAGDGLTSLREAMAAAQIDGTDSEVILTAGGHYVLDDCANTLDPQGLRHNAGTDLLAITGNGATVEQTCAGNRVLSVSAAQLTITGLMVTGGDAPNSGGGLLTTGNATISDSVFVGQRQHHVHGQRRRRGVRHQRRRRAPADHAARQHRQCGRRRRHRRR